MIATKTVYDMIISEIGIRNFKSFGNSEQTLKLNTEKGELILLVGENGAGKCVSPLTEIDVIIIIENNSNISQYLTDIKKHKMVETNDYIKGTITIYDVYHIKNDLNVDLSGGIISVDTDTGYQCLRDVDITKPNSTYLNIETSSGYDIQCSEDHLIWSGVDVPRWVRGGDLRINTYVKTRNGFEKITKIEKNDEEIDLYDIQVDHYRYYSNGIVSHNSSLMESIDYNLYNKVKGKKRRWQTLSSLPNRINKELVTRLKFKSEGTEVEVIRGQNPSILTLTENDIPYDRAGKTNVNDKIENYVGIDVETFKSFISMSINDFKNFISLSNDEKKLLLDKLFNLETVNVLNKILKDVVRDNKGNLKILDNEIETLNESINSIRASIDKVKNKQKSNTMGEIEDIKNLITSNKNDYTKLKGKRDKIGDKKAEIKATIQEKKEEHSITANEIKNIKVKIDLYNSGKCGECETDLTSDDHLDMKESYISKKKSSENINLELKESILKYEKGYDKINKMSSDVNEAFSEMTYNLKDYKKKLDKLTKKSKEDKNEDIEEFMNTVDDLSTKKINSKDRVGTLKNKSIFYAELSNVFSESGVKRSIIKNIIKPINHFISENLSHLNMPFTVTLDETFSATIEHFGQDIEHDSLSTGETKKINIALVIAYLKLIRTKNKINVLFLDEVFSSVDVESIGHILTLIRSFANDYNINIFVVHHSMLDLQNFDRVIRINKEIFSEIEEI